MTDLTPRQILDAVRRGLEETWRKIDEDTVAQASKHPQSREFAEPETQKDPKI